MRQRGFTLVEVLVAIAVVLALASAGIFGYNRLLERAYRKTCETNLKVLTTAVEFYAEENDALPATLGGLRLDQFERAYAKVMDEGRWQVKFYGAIAGLERTGEAHAGFLTYENLKPLADMDNFSDPADPNGAPSYGINTAVAGRKWSEIGENEIIVADSDFFVISGADELTRRHSTGLGLNHVAMGVTKGKKTVEFGAGSATPAASSLNDLTDYFDALAGNNDNAAVADKAEDVRNNLLSAQFELSKSTPDSSAASGDIAGAKADLQAMITAGLIDPAEGLRLMGLLQDLMNSLQGT